MSQHPSLSRHDRPERRRSGICACGLAAAALNFLAAFPACAGTPVIEPAAGDPVVTATHDDWQFTLGLYGWGAGLDGDIGVAGLPPTSVDISFSDILDTLDMTAMGAFEVRKGRWMFQFEGLYLKNSIDRENQRAGLLYQQFDLTAETTRLVAVAGYRVLEGATRVDLLAGATYYDVSNELGFYGGLLDGRRFSAGDDWCDPVVGVRVIHDFSDRWSASLRLDAGGFGVNSDCLWQAIGLVGYRVASSAYLFAGWRYAAVDYSDDGFTYDVSNSGPVLGLTITW